VWNRIKSFSKFKVYDVTCSITFKIDCKLIKKIESEKISVLQSHAGHQILDGAPSNGCEQVVVNDMFLCSADNRSQRN